MLTKLTIKNFKVFDNAEIDLADRVVFVGPNNSGKTSALQALALWSIGVRRWIEKRGDGNVPKERAGVTINRRDLVTVPTPTANLLWRDMHVREGYREDGRTKTRNVLIEIEVEGVDKGEKWTAALQFDYANEESFYCRAPVDGTGARKVVPAAAAEVKLAYLPPMSGLAANEVRLDEGALDVRIGEGRTAEVLRNLCWRAYQSDEAQWRGIVQRMKELFGVVIEDPQYIKERGEINLRYLNKNNVQLDLSASGRGQQQTLLILAHLAANPGTVLMLDEPDAHLEVLRQRQIYNAITDIAAKAGSQIIAASHSEIILNEAADRDTVVAFVGNPHRIDDRGSQLLKALKEIGFEQYLQAETTGWVLYLEGSTDLAVLRAFAVKLDHPARACLEQPFAHYVANQPGPAQKHFHGLREAKRNLVGFALYDRLDIELNGGQGLTQRMWRKREIENYLCSRDTLLAWAEEEGRKQHGDLFAKTWRAGMEAAIEKVSGALAALGKPDPWGADIKASDDFLDNVFREFYTALELPVLLRKTDYHVLAPFVPADQLDAEVKEILDAIETVAGKALPGARGA